ncbi:MAG: hypothetical protein L0Y79_02005 [Chlorobi bacterium]|nr:hypothetical protein [Chlorobiota bacterium]MCI0714837.1 hypothetical protein [Chlorobiota bacterium]
MKIIFFLLFLTISFLLLSCGDSNTTQPVNTADISVSNLKPLNSQIEGVYEAWVSIETSFDHDDEAYRSLGRFNMSSSGSIVDTSGGAFNLNIGRIGNINLTEDALITIEPPGDNDTLPGNIKFLGGAKNQQGNTLVFNLTMGYGEILGNISSQFSSASAEYLLASPSTGDTTQFNRGIWFSKTKNPPTVSGLTLPTIPDTLDWTYQAWVIDSTVNGGIYNIGRFNASLEVDDYQLCQHTPPVQTWPVPGNDWIQPNCPGGVLPDITNLNSGIYRLLITLEPRFEQGTALSKPFYIQLFYGNLPPSTYGTVLSLPNVSAGTMPSAVIRLSVSN